MATTGSNLGLKWGWGQGFNGWTADNDRNLLLLDAGASHFSAIDIVSATPGSPAAGDTYLTSNTHPTQPNKVMRWTGAAWEYITPKAGWTAGLSNPSTGSVGRMFQFFGGIWCDAMLVKTLSVDFVNAATGTFGTSCDVGSLTQNAGGNVRLTAGGKFQGTGLNLTNGTANALLKFNGSLDVVASGITDDGNDVKASSRVLYTRLVRSVWAANDTPVGGSSLSVLDAESGWTKGWMLQLGASNDLAFWNYASSSWTKRAKLYQDGGLELIGAGGLKVGAFAGTGSRLLAADATGAFVDASIPLTGEITFNSINGGKPGLYTLAGSSYTDAPPGSSGTTGYNLIQGVGHDALITQYATDTKYGGSYHRFQTSIASGAWSPWYAILDSYREGVETHSGSWSIASSTKKMARQTAAGTITLPAASATHEGFRTTITCAFSGNITIAGTYEYLDPNNSASYWYNTATNVVFPVNSGASSGSRVTFDIWCDGVYWYVRF